MSLSSKTAKRFVMMVLITLAYVLAGKIGLGFASIHVSASPVWAPAGMAVAFFLLFGFSLWPTILVGAFLVNVTTAGSVLTSGSIAIGNTLEGLLGALLVQRFAHGLRAFQSPRDVFKFSIFAGLLSPMVSATIGVTSLTWSGYASLEQYSSIWLTWWLGDAVGILIVAPALILWVQHPRVEWKTGERIELVLLVLVLFLSCEMIFGVSRQKNYPMQFLLVPVLIWAAFRFKPRETATLSVLLAGWAAWGTMNGRGPFTGESENDALLLSQTYLAVNTVMAMALAAGVQERLEGEIERKAAEEALRESEERYRITFNNAAIGIAHVGLDGRWVRVNDAVCSITGYSREELQDMTFAQITHADDIEPDWANARLLLAGKIATYTMEKRYISKLGGLLWINLTVSLLRDRTGTPTHLISVIEDISERKRIQAALHSQTAQFETLLNQAPLGVYLVDADFCLAQVNPQAVAAFDGIFPLIGRNFVDVIHAVWPKDCADEVVAIFRQTLETGEPYVVPERMVERLDRRIRVYYEWRVDRIPLRDGRYGVVCYFRDISAQVHAREIVKASEQRLRMAQQVALIGTFEWNIQTGANIWTPELEAIYGLSPGGFSRTQSGWEALVHPEDRDLAVQGVEEAFETGLPTEREFRVIWPDTTVHWLAGRWQIFKDESGKPVRLTGVNIDITKRKQTEEALRQSEERFRTLADNISQLAWTADATGWVTWYNRRWYEYTGTTLEEMRGWGWEKVHHPDHIDRVVARWKLAHVTGEAWEDTFPLRSKGGEYRWFLSRALPIRNATGQIVRWFGTNTDVSDQRMAEEALRERERFLSTVTSAARVGLVVVGPGYVYRFANAAYAEIFRLSADGIVGRHVYELLPDGWAQIQPRLDRAFGGERVSYELALSATETGDGQRYFTVSYEPHLEQESEWTVVVVVVDITNRKRAEEALRDNEERLRSFAGQLEELVDVRTEELKQSQERLRELATELNLTEQRERKRLAMDLHDHLAQMLALGKMKLAQTQLIPDLVPRCLELIKETDDVLTQSLTYTRTLVADLSPPVLHDLGLGPALTWLGDRMRRHDLTVTVRNSLETLKLPEEQAVLLFQSVRELLINVGKHAQCPHATVTVARDGSHLSIEVQDYGIGFDLPAGTARIAGLSKFGLFSIRERMRALGGLFEIDSVPGKGTTARLTLALEREWADLAPPALIMSSEPSDFAKSPNDQTIPHISRRISVLLVDDHAMVRQGLRTLLESYPDIEVVGEAGNGEEAVAFVECLQPSAT
jgi:PAS domain S-box-containing protein